MEHEDFTRVESSIQYIRDLTNETLLALPDDSHALRILEKIRATCHAFLGTCERVERVSGKKVRWLPFIRYHPFNAVIKNSAEHNLVWALEQCRISIGECLHELVTHYGILGVHDIEIVIEYPQNIKRWRNDPNMQGWMADVYRMGEPTRIMSSEEEDQIRRTTWRSLDKYIDITVSVYLFNTKSPTLWYT
jgi:hypothetical protein